MSPDDASVPPSTTASGSSTVDEIRNRHADVLGGVADHRDAHAVAGARAVKDMLGGEAAEIAADLIDDARSIAGLDAPHEPPHDAGRGDFGLEPAVVAVVLALDGIEREPSTDPA